MIRTLSVIVLPLLLVRCSPHRVIKNPKPPVSLPAQYGEKGAGSAAHSPTQWWKSFGDEQLNKLVARGLGGNFQLRGAWARLKQASAVLAQTNAAKWPQLTLDGSAS